MKGGTASHGVLNADVNFFLSSVGVNDIPYMKVSPLNACIFVALHVN
jgi:hypothetical protein